MPVLRAAKYLQTLLFSKIDFEYVFLHISMGFPGLLPGAFELKDCTANSNKLAGCDCANRKCYEFTKKFKKNQNTFSKFPNKIPQNKNGESGGLKNPERREWEGAGGLCTRVVYVVCCALYVVLCLVCSAVCEAEGRAWW